MKQLSAIFIFVCLSVILTQAAQKNRCSLQLSYNQMGFAYKYNFSKVPVWAEGYFGLGNQDIDKPFNDYLAGIKVGHPIATFKSSVLNISLHLGIYIPVNEYYKATTPVGGINVDYEKFIGKSHKHSILVDAGYQYGKRTYSQKFQNEDIYVATTDIYRVSPLWLSVGYGFNF
jgi:hypothetical protein